MAIVLGLKVQFLVVENFQPIKKKGSVMYVHQYSLIPQVWGIIVSGIQLHKIISHADLST